MHPVPVAVQPHGLVVLHMLAAPHPIQNLGPLLATVRRDQDGKGVALDFLRAVPVQPLRPGVPTEDFPVERVGDDRIFRRFDDRGVAGQGVFGLLAFSDVLSGANDLHRCASVIHHDRAATVEKSDGAVGAHDAMIADVRCPVPIRPLDRLAQ